MGSKRPGILLLGAAGQLGRELLPCLGALGQLTASARSIDALPKIARRQALDLTDSASVRDLVRQLRPELIINAAAYTAVDRAESEPTAAEALNAELPRLLAEEALAINASLVHYSTDYVFDGSGQHAWREDDPTAPLNTYGRTKLAGEQAIQRSGVPHLIVRTSWVYGRYGRNFVKTMLRLGAEHETIRVVADQFGSPTSARLLADTTSIIIGQAKGDFSSFFTEYGGILHLANAGETSWQQFAEAIFERAKAVGAPLNVKQVEPLATSEYPTAARRPLNSRLAMERLGRDFCIWPPEWQDSLSLEMADMLAANR
jgi:dTDP-4-dehydrorhamnose reductase